MKGGRKGEEAEFSEWLVEQAKLAVLSIKPIFEANSDFEFYQSVMAVERSEAFSEALRRFDVEAYADFAVWRMKRHCAEPDEASMREAIIEELRAHDERKAG